MKKSKKKTNPYRFDHDSKITRKKIHQNIVIELILGLFILE